MYMYKQGLALNNLQGLICHKTQPTNQRLPFTSKYHEPDLDVVFLSKISLFAMHCFNFTVIRIMFTTRPAIPSIRKENPQQNFVIYRFESQCDADFVYKTNQRVNIRIVQVLSVGLHE